MGDARKRGAAAPDVDGLRDAVARAVYGGDDDAWAKFCDKREAEHAWRTADAVLAVFRPLLDAITADGKAAVLTEHRICNARHGQVTCYCNALTWLSLDEYGLHIEALALPADDGARAALAEVERRIMGPSDPFLADAATCRWAANIVAEVAATLPDPEARAAIKAEALREAADAIQALHPGEVKNSVIWLRVRADNLAADQHADEAGR